MLANPVVIPVYADPIVWSIGALGLVVEISLVARLIVAGRLQGSRVTDIVVLLNLLTWIAFLIAVDQLVAPATDGVVLTLTALELAVVVVEAIALRILTHRRWPETVGPFRRLGFVAAFGVSLLGNVVSIAVSAAFPLAIWAAGALLK